MNPLTFREIIQNWSEAPCENELARRALNPDNKELQTAISFENPKTVSWLNHRMQTLLNKHRKLFNNEDLVPIKKLQSLVHNGKIWTKKRERIKLTTTLEKIIESINKKTEKSTSELNQILNRLPSELSGIIHQYLCVDELIELSDLANPVLIRKFPPNTIIKTIETSKYFEMCSFMKKALVELEKGNTKNFQDSMHLFFKYASSRSQADFLNILNSKYPVIQKPLTYDYILSQILLSLPHKMETFFCSIPLNDEHLSILTKQLQHVDGLHLNCKNVTDKGFMTLMQSSIELNHFSVNYSRIFKIIKDAELKLPLLERLTSLYIQVIPGDPTKIPSISKKIPNLTGKIWTWLDRKFDPQIEINWKDAMQFYVNEPFSRRWSASN